MECENCKKMILALRYHENALASWQFNQTFETSGSFDVLYDMSVIDDIMRLIPKVRKVTRTE